MILLSVATCCTVRWVVVMCRRRAQKRPVPVGCGRSGAASGRVSGRRVHTQAGDLGRWGGGATAGQHALFGQNYTEQAMSIYVYNFKPDAKRTSDMCFIVLLKNEKAGPRILGEMNHPLFLALIQKFQPQIHIGGENICYTRASGATTVQPF